MTFLKLRNGNYVFLTHEKQKNIDSLLFEENKDYPLISFNHHTSTLQNKLRTEYLNAVYSDSIYKISESEDYWSIIHLEGEEAQENVTDLIIDYCAEYPNMRVDKVNIRESISETIYRNMATFDDYYYPLGKLIRLTTVHVDLKGNTFFDFLKRKKKYVTTMDLFIMDIERIEGVPRDFIISLKNLQIRFVNGHINIQMLAFQNDSKYTRSEQ